MSKKLTLFEEALEANPSLKYDVKALEVNYVIQEAITEAYKASGMTFAEVGEALNIPDAAVAEMVVNNDYGDLEDMIKLVSALGFELSMTLVKKDDPNVVIVSKPKPPRRTRK